MDLLSSVLRELRLESAAYRVLELHAPWRLRFDGGLRGVHVVVEGGCELRLDDGPCRRLDPGDLVVLPRADSHVLSSPDAGSGPSLSSLDLARRTAGTRLVVPGPGAMTRVICGAFFFGDGGHPAVAGFPRCIHVPGREGSAPAWLAGLTEALTAEAMDGGPGSDVVMARLSDALVTRALRHHVEVDAQPGWLRALGDPALAAALGALHSDLSGPWTLPRLAEVAGLSRAAFAARFAAVIGEPPMQYLYRCRMRRATTLLAGDGATAAAVAARVGYGSEAAFSTAFVRYAGVPPGEYRRRARAAGPETPDGVR
jgi:AraC-like DNA-binding protein